MKRSSIAAAALLAGSLLLTGCLGGGNDAESSSTAETAKDTISIMYAFSGDQSTTFQEDVNLEYSRGLVSGRPVES